MKNNMANISELLEQYIDNIANATNKIGNYSGYYTEKCVIFENLNHMRKLLNIDKEED